MKSSYTIQLEEDVTGDIIIPLPDELLKELRWEEGDDIHIDVRQDTLVLSKVQDKPQIQTWKHFCMVEKHYIETAIHQDCNWCGETETY